MATHGVNEDEVLEVLAFTIYQLLAFTCIESVQVALFGLLSDVIMRSHLHFAVHLRLFLGSGCRFKNANAIVHDECVAVDIVGWVRSRVLREILLVLQWHRTWKHLIHVRHSREGTKRMYHLEVGAV